MNKVRLLWQRISHRLGWDYEDISDTERPEAYSYNAPLPTCELRGGCTEEMYTEGKYVYPFCERHYKMLRDGINLFGICEHPGCQTEIIGNYSRRMCDKHSSEQI